jgi:hypothetical protein
MDVQIVEPTKMCGISLPYTKSTLVISGVNDTNMKKLEKFHYVFVDNGAFEAGSTVSVKFDRILDKQIALCNNLSENTNVLAYLILPDVLMSYEQTKKMLQKYMPKIEEYRYNTMGVLQVTNTSQLKTLLKLYESYECDMVSIPIRVRERWYDRHPDIDIWEYITNNSNYWYNEIHNLGFSFKDFKHTNLFKCDSMDTSYPLKVLSQNLSLGAECKRPTNYFDLKLDEKKSKEYIRLFVEYINKDHRWEIGIS